MSQEPMVHVTTFFRDGVVFDYLVDNVIPALVKKHPVGRPLRVWVPTCSSGEEAYSLAMVLLEEIEAAQKRIQLQVFGSDTDAGAVAAARAGRYPVSIAAEISPARLAKFFVRDGNGYRVAESLRTATLFTLQNILTDPPFTRLDFLSCRNLAFHLLPEDRQRLLSVLRFALRRDGVLLLNDADAVGNPRDGFEPLAADLRIFRRTFDSDESGPPAGDESRPPAGDDRTRRQTDRNVGGPRVADLEPIIERLHQELFEVTRRLEISMAEQEAVDAESQALNEEYRSVSRALETSQQELRTINTQIGELNAKLDITATNQRASADDLDNILRSSELAIILLDATLNIRFISPAAMGVFDAVPADLGRPIADLPPKFDDALLTSDLASVLETREPVAREVRAHAGDWFERRILPYRTQAGAVQGVVLTLNNISRSKSAELKVAAERSYVASVIDTVRQPLVVLDERLEFVSVNRAFCETFHADLADLPGQTLCSVAGGALDVPAIHLFLDRARAESATIEDYEVEVQIAPRGRIVLSLGARELPDGAASERRILITIDDITDRKLANEALEIAKSKAERANQGKSRFLAAASHDLRQPLQTLSLLNGVLARKINDPTALGLVGKLNETLSAMAGILNTLLDINQLEAGTVQPEVVDFPVSTVLAKVKNEFAYLTRARGLSLRAVNSSLMVRSDPLLLAQMIRNLVSNAVKYTKQGKVLIGCRRRRGVIRIEVRDTGIGIPGDQLDAIFEEYYQLDNPARERALGLGMGLSIVRRLGELLNHDVGVESVPGEGSVFFVEVPLASDTHTQSENDEVGASPAPSQRSESVLIVEDDPMVSEALVLLLRGEGYRTLVATDAAEVAALQQKRDFAPDLVIADYSLPGPANGLEIIKRLRSDLDRPLPAIVLTGNIADSVLRKVVAADCNYFYKPVNVDRFIQHVKDIISSAPRAPVKSELPRPRKNSSQSLVHVVDDDSMLLDALRDTLEHGGYEVETYKSAELFLAANARSGCLIVDSVMPGISGLDLLRRLKSENRNLPSIVITGYGDIQMAIKAMHAGAMDFIEKPAHEEKLVAAVDRALAQASSSTERSEPQISAAECIAALTPRERQVMYLVVEGLPNKHIAEKLGISQRTVESHRAAVMKRTKSASLPDLIRLVMRSV